MLDRFLNDNCTSMRFARTVVQGVIAALVVFVPTAVGYFQLAPEVASLVTAVVMAVLSPLMAMLRKTDKIEDDEDEWKDDEEDGRL